MVPLHTYAYFMFFRMAVIGSYVCHLSGFFLVSIDMFIGPLMVFC